MELKAIESFVLLEGKTIAKSLMYHDTFYLITTEGEVFHGVNLYDETEDDVYLATTRKGRLMNMLAHDQSYIISRLREDLANLGFFDMDTYKEEMNRKKEEQERKREELAEKREREEYERLKKKFEGA